MILDDFKQNLIDAGCDATQINIYLKLAKAQNKTELIEQLIRQRKLLLTKMHAKQREIECLDYLIWQITNKN